MNMATQDSQTQPPGAKQVVPVPLGNIRKNDLPATNTRPAPLPQNGYTIEHFLEVPITLVFEVGRTDITIGQLLELDKGSFVDLRQVSVDIIDVRANDRIIAFGETIALKKRYGIRFGELETVFGLEDDGGRARIRFRRAPQAGTRAGRNHWPVLRARAVHEAPSGRHWQERHADYSVGSVATGWQGEDLGAGCGR
jgi:flagellar motor switch protein FliN/FliY